MKNKKHLITCLILGSMIGSSPCVFAARRGTIVAPPPPVVETVVEQPVISTVK